MENMKVFYQSGAECSLEIFYEKLIEIKEGDFPGTFLINEEIFALDFLIKRNVSSKLRLVSITDKGNISLNEFSGFIDKKYLSPIILGRNKGVTGARFLSVESYEDLKSMEEIIEEVILLKSLDYFTSFSSNYERVLKSIGVINSSNEFLFVKESTK